MPASCRRDRGSTRRRPAPRPPGREQRPPAAAVRAGGRRRSPRCVAKALRREPRDRPAVRCPRQRSRAAARRAGTARRRSRGGRLPRTPDRRRRAASARPASRPPRRSEELGAGRAAGIDREPAEPVADGAARPRAARAGARRDGARESRGTPPMPRSAQCTSSTSSISPRSDDAARFAASQYSPWRRWNPGSPGNRPERGGIEQRRGKRRGAAEPLGALGLIAAVQRRLEQLADDAERELVLELTAAGAEHPQAASCGRAAAPRATSDVFPIPAGPSTTSTLPSPAPTAATISAIAARSDSRPSSCGDVVTVVISRLRSARKLSGKTSGWLPMCRASGGRDDAGMSTTGRLSIEVEIGPDGPSGHRPR